MRSRVVIYLWRVRLRPDPDFSKPRQILRAERAPARLRPRQPADESKALWRALGDIERLQRENGIDVGEIDPAHEAALTDAHFAARRRIDDEDAGPRRRFVEAVGSARVGLAGKLAHAVFVPDVLVAHGKCPRELRVEIDLGNLATAALEAAGFEQQLPRGRRSRGKSAHASIRWTKLNAVPASPMGRRAVICAQSVSRRRVKSIAWLRIQNFARAAPVRFCPEAKHGAERGVRRFDRRRSKKVKRVDARKKADPARALDGDGAINIRAEQMLSPRADRSSCRSFHKPRSVPASRRNTISRA